MSFFGGIRALQQLLTDTSKTEWHFTGAATERCKPGTKVWEGAYWRALSDRELKDCQERHRTLSDHVATHVLSSDAVDDVPSWMVEYA